MRAARYLGVPMWELEQQPSYYRDRALCAEAAEDWAETERRKRDPKTKFG